MTSRRPIEQWEASYLQALGHELEELRSLAGLSQAELAARAILAVGTYSRIANARRRTRASTLERLVRVFVEAHPSLGDPQSVLDMLLATVGPALAEESPYRDRIEHRRDRRQRRRQREVERWREVWRGEQ